MGYVGLRSAKKAVAWWAASIIMLLVTIGMVVSELHTGFIILVGFVTGLCQVKASWWSGYAQAIKEVWENYPDE